MYKKGIETANGDVSSTRQTLNMSYNHPPSAPARSAAQDIAVIQDELDLIKKGVKECVTYLHDISATLDGSAFAAEVPLLDGTETENLYYEWQNKIQSRIDAIMKEAPQKSRILYIASRTTGAAYQAIRRRLYPQKGSSLAVIATGFGTVRDDNDALAILHAHIQNNWGGRNSFA